MRLVSDSKTLLGVGASHMYAYVAYIARLPNEDLAVPMPNPLLHLAPELRQEVRMRKICVELASRKNIKTISNRIELNFEFIFELKLCQITVNIIKNVLTSVTVAACLGWMSSMCS